MYCLTRSYSIGTWYGRDSSLDREIFYHPDNCEDNIDGEKIGGIVEGKAVPDRSCSLPKDSDLAFNLWDVFI